MVERKANGASSAALDRFRLIPFGEIVPRREGNYVVKGLIPHGLTVAWGPPKSGKSFWAFDVAVHVALGWRYRDHKVTAGAVCYLAFEGAHGFGARVEAFRQAKLADDHEPPPFYLMGERLDLIGDHPALIERIRQQWRGTAGHCRAGHAEPVPGRLGKLGRGYNRIHRRGRRDPEAFDCSALIVHHCGMDGTRPRGHTSLTGACDAQLAVKREGDGGVFSVTVEFNKDGPEGEVIACRLETVDIGEDEDGDEMRSCVVVEADHVPSAKRTSLSPKQRRAMDALNNLIADHGMPAPDAQHYPAGARVVSVETWREQLGSAGILNTGNPRQAWTRIHDDSLMRAPSPNGTGWCGPFDQPRPEKFPNEVH